MSAIVLLHGATGASDQLVSLGNALKKHFDVYLMDFTGHGSRSGVDSVFSIENFAADLDDFLAKNNLVHPTLFGYSMGGYVALLHARHFNNYAERIITLGTKFKWNSEIAKQEIKMLDADKIQQKVPQFAKQLMDRHGEKNWEKVLEKTADMMVRMGDKSPLSANELHELNIPVRIGIGDRDQMVSVEESIEIYKACRHGSFYVLPDTAHPVEKVRVQDMVSQITQFVKS